MGQPLHNNLQRAFSNGSDVADFMVAVMQVGRVGLERSYCLFSIFFSLQCPLTEEQKLQILFQEGMIGLTAGILFELISHIIEQLLVLIADVYYKERTDSWAVLEVAGKAHLELPFFFVQHLIVLWRTTLVGDVLLRLPLALEKAKLIGFEEWSAFALLCLQALLVRVF